MAGTQSLQPSPLPPRLCKCSKLESGAGAERRPGTPGWDTGVISTKPNGVPVCAPGCEPGEASGRIRGKLLALVGEAAGAERAAAESSAINKETAFVWIMIPPVVANVCYFYNF